MAELGLLLVPGRWWVDFFKLCPLLSGEANWSSSDARRLAVSTYLVMRDRHTAVERVYTVSGRRRRRKDERIEGGRWSPSGAGLTWEQEREREREERNEWNGNDHEQRLNGDCRTHAKPSNAGLCFPQSRPRGERTRWTEEREQRQRWTPPGQTVRWEGTTLRRLRDKWAAVIGGRAEKQGRDWRDWRSIRQPQHAGAILLGTVTLDRKPAGGKRQQHRPN
jgi:hypothetical protein